MVGIISNTPFQLINAGCAYYGPWNFIDNYENWADYGLQEQLLLSSQSSLASQMTHSCSKMFHHARICVCVCVCVKGLWGWGYSIQGCFLSPFLVTHRHWQPTITAGVFFRASPPSHTPKIPRGLNCDVKVKLSMLTRSLSSFSSPQSGCFRPVSEPAWELQSDPDRGGKAPAVNEPLLETLPVLQLDSRSKNTNTRGCCFHSWLQTQTAMLSSTGDREDGRLHCTNQTALRRREEEHLLTFTHKTKRFRPEN